VVDEKRVDRLVQNSKRYAALRGQEITTVDPILRVARSLYPFMSTKELLILSQSALRVILSQRETPYYQTTLLSVSE